MIRRSSIDRTSSANRNSEFKSNLRAINRSTVIRTPQDYAIPRERMVERLRDHYGIRDQQVLEAMRACRVTSLCPKPQGRAYGDHALPISANQTISQPYIVARMTELLELIQNSRVLEIGAGSGYQTAVLAKVAAQVYAIERIGELAREAQARIRELGNLQRHGQMFRRHAGLGRECTVRCDSGGRRWSNYSRTAGGATKNWRPTGGSGRTPREKSQTLVRVIKTEKGIQREDHGPALLFR